MEIRGARKSFGEKRVLWDFSFRFPERGTVCLFGPSGCGKTTLLNCIAGLEKLDSGEVAGIGDRRVSFVFQEDRLLPWCTAEENVEVVLRGSRAENRDAARRLLTQAGLGGEAGSRPAQLSGGMKRRISIMRALAFGGGLYLLDEPFQRLDGETRSKMAELVAEKTADALCILVTHDLKEAEKMADTIVFLGGPPLFVKKIRAVKRPGG